MRTLASPPRILAVVALVIAATLPLAAAAPAAPARGSQKAAPNARLLATGTGAISVQGVVVAYGLVPEGGTLFVQDTSGRAHVTVNGARKRMPRRGALRLASVSGRFYVDGENLRMRVTGAQMTVAIAGRGRVLLEGSGSFTLNDGAAATWPTPPTTVDLQPPGR